MNKRVSIGGALVSGGFSVVIPVGTTAVKGIVELAESGETATDVVIQGDDARIPTSDEKSALIGTDGPPSVTNPYVTKQTIEVIDGGTF